MISSTARGGMKTPILQKERGNSAPPTTPCPSGRNILSTSPFPTHPSQNAIISQSPLPSISDILMNNLAPLSMNSSTLTADPPNGQLPPFPQELQLITYLSLDESVKMGVQAYQFLALLNHLKVHNCLKYVPKLGKKCRLTKFCWFKVIFPLI